MIPPLEQASDNYTEHLERALAIIGRGADDPDAYFAAAWSWRILAICRLLGDADVDAFADCLCRSGQARLAFLRKTRAGLRCEPQYVCASRNVPFTASVAGGDIETARAIALLSPTSHVDSVEYEDDFLFFHLMHRLAIAPDDAAGHAAILARWKDVLEGGDSGPLAVCRGLVGRDAAEFASGFAALLADQRSTLAEYRESPGFNEQLFATEGRVYVEALAVLRFAELRGLQTEREYPLVPAIARVPVPTEKPPENRWLSPVF